MKTEQQHAVRIVTIRSIRVLCRTGQASRVPAGGTEPSTDNLQAPRDHHHPDRDECIDRQAMTYDARARGKRRGKGNCRAEPEPILVALLVAVRKNQIEGPKNQKLARLGRRSSRSKVRRSHDDFYTDIGGFPWRGITYSLVTCNISGSH